METESSGLAVVAAARALGLGRGGNGDLSLPLPFEDPIVLFEGVRLVGCSHPSCTAAVEAPVGPAGKLVLRHQADNLSDKWAVEVLYEGKRLGWLPADCNQVVARLLDGGKDMGAELAEEPVGRFSGFSVNVSLRD